MKNNQKGFSHILLILIFVVVLGGALFFAYSRVSSNNNNKPKNQSDNNATNNQEGSKQQQASNSDEPKIKNLPIKIEKYNPATGMAGDMKFTKWASMKTGGLEAVFLEYGNKIKANSARESRLNPQPTFVAPLGTKVHSIVDGTVYDVPKLYSNDYSIMVQGKDQSVIFETEHVINPLVKKGDTVKAGQVIAEVSDYDSRNLDGLGLVEMGVLLPGNPPQHACTFDYLDSSVKNEISSQITQLMTDWESYMGDQNIYDQASMPVPGCATQDKVEG